MEEYSLKGMGVVQVLEFVQRYGKLKNVYRSNCVQDGRKESVAEHCWRLALLVVLVAPGLDQKIDIEKAMKMALIHDLAESVLGDTDILVLMENRSLMSSKEVDEHKQFDEMKKLLGGALGQEFYDLWVEFTENVSYEAKVVNALDKLEAQIQQNEIGSTKWKEFEKSGKLAALESFFTFDTFLNDLKNEINLKRTI